MKKRDFSVLGQGVIKSILDKSALTRYSIDRERVHNALNRKSAEDLVEISQYFFHNSGEYRRLVEYFAGILTNDFLVLPQGAEEDMEGDRFTEAFAEILDYTERSNIKETSREIALSVVRDGAYFGYERDLNGQITMQTLPSNYCRSRFKIMGVYAVEFDYSFFAQYRGEDLEEVLSAFPDEFRQGYLDYIRDRQNNRWQILNPEYARAHMLNNKIPFLSPVFLDLIELEEYKRIHKTKAKLDIYKIIVQKIPLNRDGELTFELNELEDFHKNLRKMVSEDAVDVATTVCDVDSIDLQDKAQSVRDDIEQATNIIYSTAGTPMALFNSASSGSIALKESIKVDESIMLPLLQQYERWYKNKFSTISSEYNFKIIFPPITHYNRKEMMELYTKGASQGFPTKLLTMASLGINQSDMDSLLNYENNILKSQEKMIPTSSSYNSPMDEGGRPQSDEPLSDEGDKTRDGNKNENRAKGD